MRIIIKHYQKFLSPKRIRKDIIIFILHIITHISTTYTHILMLINEW